MRVDKGVTLLELMMTMAILSIAVFLLFPLTRHFMTRNRAKARLTQLTTAIRYARQIALTHHSRVILCGSVDGQTCGRQWQSGQLILFEDAIENAVIRYFPSGNDSGHLLWRGFRGNKIRFLPTGLASAASGSFWYCGDKQQKQANWRLVLNRVGRMRIETQNVRKSCV